MSGWHEVQLKEIVSFVVDNRGKTPPTCADGYELLEVNVISQAKRNPDYTKTRKFVSEDIYVSWFRNGHPVIGDILVPTVGTIGNVAFVNESRGTIAQNLIALRFKPGVDCLYVYYYLSSPYSKELMISLDIGGVQPSIKVPHLLDMQIKLPLLNEQKAIASVLSNLDDKIDLLNRQNKTLEAMAETLFRQWFVEEAGEDCSITELVDFNPTRKLKKGTIAPYLGMTSLSTTTFAPDGWYDREFTSGTKFVNGDTLLARITPCLENGKTAYITFLKENQVCWGSTEFIVMHPRSGLHPFFGYVLARNQVFREYAEGCMAGSSGRQRVDVEHLKKFDISSPSEELISQFNKIADVIAPKLHNNMMQIKTLEKLRDSLLPKLMSGEVRVE